MADDIPQGTAETITGATSGYGGWVGTVGGLAGTVVGLFEGDSAKKQTIQREQLLAEREFELEKLRVLNQHPPPPPTPTYPISMPGPSAIQQLPTLPVGLSPNLLLGGMLLLGVALVMRRRGRR